MKKSKHPILNMVLIFTLLLSLVSPAFPANQVVAAAAESILTVEQAIADNTGTATVEGYIVGYTIATNNYSKEAKDDNNLAIASSIDETDPGKIMPVQLPAKFRNEFGLATNPTNIGKKIQVTGTLQAYFTTPGIKSPTAITFVEDSEENPNKTAAVEANIIGRVEAGTKITLSSSTAGAAIYYTTNGETPTSASTLYEGPITINAATTIKAIAIADGLENSDVATFEYTLLSSMPIKEVRQLALNETAMTTGVVTATFGSPTNTVYIQDDDAGIVLYGAGQEVEIGDRVQAKGKLTQYQNLLELEVKKSDVTVIEKTTVPTPQIVTPGQLQEDKEAMLLTLEKVTIESTDGKNFTASTPDGETFVIRPDDAALLTVGATYDTITGVLGQYKETYQLIPRGAADIVADASKVQPVVATPGAGFIKAGEEITLSTNTKGATIYYTVNGDEPTTASTVYNAPITLTEDAIIKAIAVKDGLTSSSVATFTYTIMTGEMRIHHIQGAGHYSQFENQTVSDIEGIVTFVKDGSNFYMQDLQPDNDDQTSEGILVNKSSHGLKVGDVVSVTGTVEEYLNEGYSDRYTTDLPVTRIKASSFTKKESGHELPAPIVIGKDRIAPTEIIDNDSFAEFDPEEDGIDFYESLEGMYVEIENPKVVAPQSYGDLVVVPGSVETNTNAGGLKFTPEDANPERITIDLNDNSFVAKAGDSFNGSFKGVVSYGYSNYMVMPNKNELPTLVEGTTAREVTAIEKKEDKLTIATYNVENFSAVTEDARVTKIAQSIITNLKTPDIIQLTEIQDNDGEADSGNSSADQTYKVLIDKIAALGGPTYSFTDIAPVNNQDGGAAGGNIRVGFLYNPERVTLSEGTKGTATQAVGYENNSLTLNPGRIDPTNEAFKSSRKPLAAQFEFKGEKVVVIANHTNSKRGDMPLFGKTQPVVLQSEVQRNKIATVVNHFVKEIKTENPDANVVLLGDFNDFEFSNPLQIVKGNELINMIDRVPFEKRYSYSYQGNSQVLDHILVSNNMAADTEVDIVHINSSFMEEHGRASDHDPVLIQTTLQKQKEETFAKTYNLSAFKSNKLSVNTENSLVTMSADSSITEGITVKASATLKGEGLATTKVILNAAEANSYVDFKGATVQEVVIENANFNKIKGAENVQKWTVKDGVDASHIKFYNSAGPAIPSPVLPSAPETDADGYYANADGKTGEELKTALHNIIKGHTQLTYDEVKYALRDTDEDPNNPDNVLLLYTGRSQAKDTFGSGVDDWNREHVWAKSHGQFGTAKGPGTDLHHLRAADASVNSSRGHLDFDNGGTPHKEATDNKYDSDSWEPADRVKGDIARMLFYMAVRYEGTDGEIDLELADRVSTYPEPLHGKLSVLLEWNELDPVDDFERNRNEVIYNDYQHNRNPFIDHPEWVNEIWGDAA
ncbi:chitobiase/beta-hexosaminidase C-terminal domain-containing protein [Bacillus testis]|uniref:chitobiase/beta-hexosaminidase C-terminal domain-containing protein n=1 Tax=Bacillus testis TaxID=1622072 RepID=UPI000841146E|nr:chitobiase/beta-hexosaminidase C-terminal domain-containing protein [Bacillus testis]